MNMQEFFNICGMQGWSYTDPQKSFLANKLQNDELTQSARVELSGLCRKPSTDKIVKIIKSNHSQTNSDENRKQINAGEYMTVPKLSNIPAFIPGELIPCTVPKISIPGPNCQDNLLPNYIARADFLGLLPYVLAYFDHMFMIDNIRQLFTKHMRGAEFDRYYQESKSLWARPLKWDEPAKEISSSDEEYKRTA